MLGANLPNRQRGDTLFNYMPTKGQNERDLSIRLTPDHAEKIQNYFIEGDGRMVTRKGYKEVYEEVGGIEPSMLERFDNDNLVYAYNDGTDTYLSVYNIPDGTSTTKHTFTGSTNKVNGKKYGSYFYATNDDDKLGVIHLTGEFIKFDAGTTEFTIGSTLTGAGGATGTIAAMTVLSGTWAGNDAAGVILLTDITGVYVNNETLTGSSGGDADADGTQDEWYEVEDAPICKVLEIHNSYIGSTLIVGDLSTEAGMCRWCDFDTNETEIPFLVWESVTPPDPTDSGYVLFRGGGQVNDIISFKDRVVVLYDDATTVFKIETIDVDGTGLSQNVVVIDQEFNFGGFTGAAKSRDAIFYVNERGIFLLSIDDSGKFEINISNILGESRINDIKFDNSDIEWDGSQRVFITCANKGEINNFVLVYDIQKELWTEITGWGIDKICRVQKDLYAVESYDAKIDQLLFGNDDNGEAIECKVIFKEEDFGDPATLKGHTMFHIGGKFSPSTRVKIDFNKWNHTSTETEDFVTRYLSGSGTAIDFTGYGVSKTPVSKTTKDSLDDAGMKEVYGDDLIKIFKFLKLQIEISESAFVPHELHWIRMETYPIRLTRNRNILSLLALGLISQTTYLVTHLAEPIITHLGDNIII